MSQIYDVITKVTTVVFVGGFNTLKHTPELLYHYNLINEEDYNDSKIDVLNINQLLVRFPWGAIQITPASEKEFKLIVSMTDQGAFSLFQDLIYSLLELNDTTLISALGLNFSRMIQHKSSDEWHRWGHKLAPDSIWLNAFSKNDKSKHCGMRNIFMMIDSILEPIEKVVGKNTSLNIDIKPTPESLDKEFSKNETEINVNYHFPINADNCINVVHDTLEKYLEDLHLSIDEQVERLIAGELHE